MKMGGGPQQFGVDAERVPALLDSWAVALELPAAERQAWPDAGAWHDALRNAPAVVLRTLAGDDALEDVDYAADQLFQRQDGLDFDPWYYQYGEDLGGGVFIVEGGYYLERIWDLKKGERDVDFATKVQQVRRQLERREAEIVFDPNTESIGIVVRKPGAA